VTRHAYTNAQIFAQQRLQSGCALLVEQGIITGLVNENEVPEGSLIVDLEGARLVPGFIDLQVNGGNGFLFNDCPTLDTVRAIAEAHYQFGTTALLPTLISDDLDVVERGIIAIEQAISAGVPGIAGIHIEGPFLNVERRGIHPRDKIRHGDENALKVLRTVEGGVTLVTLAPECVPAEQVTELRDRGMIVCAGHTDATFDEMMNAFNAGVAGVTHLFNAMPPLLNRAPGVVGAALLHSESWCCIIVDGKHVNPAALQIAIRAKGGHQRFILVTDAMPTVGQSDKHFMLNGEQVMVIDGVCQNNDGTLAGSDLDMAKAVANAQSMLGMSLAQAVEMATFNPAQFLGLSHQMGVLEVGKRANMVCLSPSGEVLATWIDGQKVWGASS
jgi:N-acetylglucosamine-6-phosphate deacetylase